MDPDAEPSEGVHADGADEARADHSRPDVAPDACNHLTTID
jgi:hypothetical protein